MGCKMPPHRWPLETREETARNSWRWVIGTTMVGVVIAEYGPEPKGIIGLLGWWTHAFLLAWSIRMGFRTRSERVGRE